MIDENVLPRPPPLERLAMQIKRDLERCTQAVKKSEDGRREWIEGAFDLCVHLAQAKQDNPALLEFGQWCADNGFGEAALSHQDRAAAIEMGKEPDALRKCLTETKRRSLRLIHQSDFPRFTSDGKTKPRLSKISRYSLTETQTAEIINRHFNHGESPGHITRALFGNPKAKNSRVSVIEAIAAEQGRREAEPTPIDPGKMAPTMQQRYEATLRLARKQIREELIEEVRAEVYREVEEGYLKYWREKCANAERILASHKGVISRKDYRIVLAGLHPDHNRFEQAREAFEALKNLEKVLVKPDPPVFSGPPLPATVAELMARRRGR
jgi:hypothetical protein